MKNMNGGLATRPTPLIIEMGKDGKMLSPDLKNVDFFRKGGISKRLGKTQVGNTITNTIYRQQTERTTSDGFPAAVAITGYYATSFSTGPSAATITSCNAYLAALFSAPITSVDIEFAIYTNSSGIPGAVVGAVGTINIAVSSSTPTARTFTPSSPIVLSANTSYWIRFKSTGDGINTFASFSYNSQTNAIPASLQSSDGSTWTKNIVFVGGSPFSINLGAYFILNGSGDEPVFGIHDYRSNSNLTRNQLEITNGNVYKRDKDSGGNFISTWTSLWAEYNFDSINQIASFATLKNYDFISNASSKIQRVWDGTSTYTIQQGFRATFSAARSAAAGTVPAAYYKIMAVTQLVSGGYRSSAESAVIDMSAGGTQQIAVSSVVMDGTSASNFGFDIAATATTWFIASLATATTTDYTYYKIPTGDMSTGNPSANNTTAFNITALTSLTTSNTTLDQYSLPQAYFTSQVTTPSCSYMAVWQDILCMAGDPSNPSRVWFSEQLAPNIWSTYGQLLGSYIEVDDGDGDVIKGLFAWNGSLYVLKQHSVHIVEFTGNAALPFDRRRLPGDIGALAHWSCKDIGSGFVFLSERGIALCSGTIISLAPGSDNILDYFDPADANVFNLTLLQYSTGGLNRTKGQVCWTVATTSSASRNQVLIYDYINNAFWLDDGISGNYFTEVGDSNGFFSVWSGDYSGKIYQHESGTSDNGSAIDWYFYCPWLEVGQPSQWKHWDWLQVSGDVQASGTLTMTVYVDFSTTAARTLTIDMSAARFKTGIRVPLGLRAKYIQVKFSNSTLDIPVHIDTFGISYRPLGVSA